MSETSVRRRRIAWWSWLDLHLAAFFVFLYLPILVLIALSFNRSGLPTAWTGMTLDWYAKLFSSPDIGRALLNTLIVAVAVTLLSTVIGTAIGLALMGTRPPPALEALLFAPMIIPDIVLAIALASFYYLVGLSLGLHSIVLSHVVFDIAFVTAVVRTRLAHFDRSIIEASIDLGAGDWTTFRRITLPVIARGVVAAGLLAFTLSIDEFIIAYFTSGAGTSSTTLPMKIFSMVRFGVTPDINALAAILMTVSFVIVLASQRLERKGRT
ncbi:MAG: ABC transporter permease [Hyphomicrobiaceae bacterium]